MTQVEIPCACGSGLPLARCCGPLITGAGRPATAEALMRSRYTAHTLGETDYLRRTWHPHTRHRHGDSDDAIRWLGLKVLRVEQGGAADDRGLVEFVARYKVGGRGHRLHEISRFRRCDGQWMYLDGEEGSTSR